MGDFSRREKGQHERPGHSGHDAHGAGLCDCGRRAGALARGEGPAVIRAEVLQDDVPLRAAEANRPRARRQQRNAEVRRIRRERLARPDGVAFRDADLGEVEPAAPQRQVEHLGLGHRVHGAGGPSRQRDVVAATESHRPSRAPGDASETTLWSVFRGGTRKSRAGVAAAPGA